MSKPWLAHYPPDMPAELGELPYRTLAELLDESFARFADRQAFIFMQSGMSYGELDRHSRVFAAYLQSLGLAPGDRVALMMPNVFQYPVAVAGVVRAGMVVVNTNPLYTPRELRHQLADSGARAIVILENMAATLDACRSQLPVEHVVVTSVGDMLPRWKGIAVDLVLRHFKRAVPRFQLPGSVRWRAAMRAGRSAVFRPVARQADDPVVLQYTGGTTGTAKGATLTNRNIVANVLQSELWNRPGMRDVPAEEQVVTVCALPLYHIFGFTVNMMLSVRQGGCNLLIANPRDIPALIKALRKQRFHLFPAVNTLFAAISRHRAAATVDWSHLRISVGGGMAVQASVAERWLELTGSPLCEGYGLSETAPVAACNLVTAKAYTGTIGLPLPSTELRVIGEDERELQPGEAGEIAIRGPQLMAGYWNQPDETRAALTRDGFFKTGDIGIMEADGAVRIVDRKKDMINVSGFNVYPNEIEGVATSMPGVVEAAAVGVRSAASGEAVKLFVVRSDPQVTEASVKAFCREHLAAYKRPRFVEFRNDLPKSGVGKVLRRALRELDDENATEPCMGSNSR